MDQFLKELVDKFIEEKDINFGTYISNNDTKISIGLSISKNPPKLISPFEKIELEDKSSGKN